MVISSSNLKSLKIAFYLMNRNSFGCLYIVATPIGNLQDISLRAIEVLKKVDWIAAEDTRHSLFLLQQYGIKTQLISLHEHNESERLQKLIQHLQNGESVALISDAGTPLISDPGFNLVREAKLLGITVIPIPGACAAIAALSASGLPTDRFVFEGFLPAKNTARINRLENLLHESRTLIFYEAPHRILDLLEAMQKVFGGKRKVVIARELTKMYETIFSADLDEVIAWMTKDKNQQRGEMVVLVEGATQSSELSNLPSQKILTILLEKLSVKDAAELAAKITGEKKNDLYQVALEIKKLR